MKRVVLKHSAGETKILIGKGLIRQAGTWLKRAGCGSRVLIVSNPVVAKKYLKTVQNSIKAADFETASMVLPHGNERDKSISVLESIWKKMMQVSLDRSSSVVALGGGVVGDVTGFAAATYMRGIAVVQIPTTLLAQVDSAIGGKTAVDLGKTKNIVGAFHQPRLVLSDVDLVRTLPLPDIRNSFAEIIKYGMICDQQLFKKLERQLPDFLDSFKNNRLSARDLRFLEDVIWRCSRIKAAIVSRDEFETKGERMILNYGHTFGHALEAVSHFRLRHGEAVAIGMVLAGKIAVNAGFFSKRDEERQSKLIRATGLPVFYRLNKTKISGVMQHMLRDKKAEKGRLRLVLPSKIGCVRILHDFDPGRVQNMLVSAMKGERP